MRTVLRDVLIAEGVSKVYEAKDGAEAIDCFRKYRQDLVLLDIIMPGVNGMEALKAILQIDQKANVVMVTAIGQERTVDEAISLGAKDYVIKPFKPAAIAKVLSRITI
ncbi:MAG: response regulator [Thaumarchaeota archaeon]|nr:response regulator [Nitrososphaerota archaeon]